MIVKHAVVAGLVTLWSASTLIGCAELEFALATPTSTPLPTATQTSAPEPTFTQTSTPEPTFTPMPTVTPSPEPTAIISPTPFVLRKGYTGGSKSNGKENSRSYVATPRSAPTSTPIPPTSTPYPTPTSKTHLKPEYVATAERIVDPYPNNVDLQVEVYGRELDIDEIVDLLKGISHWHTVDFLLRCMVERRMKPDRFHNIFSSNGDGVEWEYPQATEKVLRRFPEAELVKDSSGFYFLVENLGPGYTPAGFLSQNAE